MLAMVAASKLPTMVRVLGLKKALDLFR